LIPERWIHPTYSTPFSYKGVRFLIEPRITFLVFFGGANIEGEMKLFIKGHKHIVWSLPVLSCMFEFIVKDCHASNLQAGRSVAPTPASRGGVPCHHHRPVLPAQPYRSFDQQSFANHPSEPFVGLIVPQWDVIGKFRRRQAGMMDNAVKYDPFMLPNLPRPHHLLRRHPAGGGVGLAA
jgi:hypothetical protein